MSFWQAKKKEIIIAAAMVAIAALAFAYPSGFRRLFGIREADQWNFNVPKYAGRPLAEYRETPEEVKLFNEDQKQKLRARLKDYGDAVAANPDQLDAWLQGGLVKKAIGDYEGARDAWEYAALIRPQAFAPFKNLGEIYWRYLPDFPKSEMNFRQAIKNDPAVLDAYLSLSDLYRYSYKEKSDLADDVLLEGLAKNLGLGRDLTAYLARYYKETGNKEKAIEYYEKLKSFEPDNGGIDAELLKLRAR